MNLNSINSTPFTATIIRQTHPVRNHKDGKVMQVESTEKQFLDSFDSQIRKIQEAKTKAIELDTFMRSEEVAELIEQLPENDTIEVAANFCLDSLEDEKEIKIGNPYLLYGESSIRKAAPNLSYDDAIELSCIEVQNKNGSFDKEQILNWLQKLVKVFNEK